MKISTIRIAVLLFFLGLSKLANAQVPIPQDVVDDYVVGITKDFNRYMGNYMNPVLKGLGYGFNNGWYNTARPHKSFGFDLTISVNAAYVPTIDQSFKFVPDDYEALDLPPNQDDVFPTVMGGTTENEVRSYLSKGNPDPVLGSLYVQSPILDGIQEQLPVNAVAVPSPIIQLGVGIYKGTEVKVRWVPTIENTGGLTYKYFGLGVMHSVSQWIPVLKDLKFLDVSGFVGFTNIDLSYELEPGTIDGANQVANFGVNTTTYEVVGSATFSVITGFVGIGYDNFKSHLNMNGEYDFKIPISDTGTSPVTQTVENPVSLNAKDGGFRANVGARLKLAILTLHASYSLQEYNTLNVGIGFSFR